MQKLTICCVGLQIVLLESEVLSPMSAANRHALERLPRLRLADRNFCRRYASQLTNLSISLPSAEERPNPAGVRLMGA